MCVCVCVCQRKTKDRADGVREKSAHCPRWDVCVCVVKGSGMIGAGIPDKGSPDKY